MYSLFNFIYKAAFLSEANLNQIIEQRVKEGEYSLKMLPVIDKFLLEQVNHIEGVGQRDIRWVQEFLTEAIFKRVGELIKNETSFPKVRDDVLAEQNLLEEHANDSMPDLPAEIQNEIKQRLAEAKKNLDLDAVQRYGQDPNLINLVFIGENPQEFHNIIYLMLENPDSFKNIARTMRALYSAVDSLREASKDTKVLQEEAPQDIQENSTILNYIRSNPINHPDLRIEPIGIWAGITEEQKDQVAERLKAEEKAGQVCTWSVHGKKTLSGTSIFASIITIDGKHVATIKFEDGEIYEIKGTNNERVGKNYPREKALEYREAVREYVNKMLSDDNLGLILNPSYGSIDYNNLLEESEVQSKVKEGVDDYSPYLASDLISEDEIILIYSRIKHEGSEKEFTFMAMNGKTPYDIQKDLYLNHGTQNVKMGLAKNERLREDVYNLLINDPNKQVRFKAYANPYAIQNYQHLNGSISREDALGMLKSKDTKVVSRAIISPDLTDKDISDLANDPNLDPNIKANLVLNKNISLPLRQKVFDTFDSKTQFDILDQAKYGFGATEGIKFKELDNEDVLKLNSEELRIYLYRLEEINEELSLSLINRNPKDIEIILIAARGQISSADFKKLLDENFDLISNSSIFNSKFPESKTTNEEKLNLYFEKFLEENFEKYYDLESMLKTGKVRVDLQAKLLEELVSHNHFLFKNFISNFSKEGIEEALERIVNSSEFSKLIYLGDGVSTIDKLIGMLDSLDPEIATKLVSLNDPYINRKILLLDLPDDMLIDVYNSSRNEEDLFEKFFIKGSSNNLAKYIFSDDNYGPMDKVRQLGYAAHNEKLESFFEEVIESIKSDTPPFNYYDISTFSLMPPGQNDNTEKLSNSIIELFLKDDDPKDVSINMLTDVLFYGNPDKYFNELKPYISDLPEIGLQLLENPGFSDDKLDEVVSIIFASNNSKKHYYNKVMMALSRKGSLKSIELLIEFLKKDVEYPILLYIGNAIESGHFPKKLIPSLISKIKEVDLVDEIILYSERYRYTKLLSYFQSSDEEKKANKIVRMFKAAMFIKRLGNK